MIYKPNNIMIYKINNIMLITSFVCYYHIVAVCARLHDFLRYVAFLTNNSNAQILDFEFGQISTIVPGPLPAFSPQCLDPSPPYKRV